MTNRTWDKQPHLHNGKPCWSCDRPLLSLCWEDGKWELLEWGVRQKPGYRLVGRYDNPDEAKIAKV